MSAPVTLSLDLSARMTGFALAARGEFALGGVTALFGPSGSGKSTVLAAIAGFRPEIGRVAVGGALWQGPGAAPTPPHRRPVGLVFQDGRLFEHLSVRGNLDFAARRADPDGPAIDRDDVIAALELDRLLDRRVSALSGGEARRVAIARALMIRPRLLLMDEPLSGLDRALKAAVLPMIAALPERFGLPVLFVSHIVDEIAQISDRLIAMRDGAFEGDGPAREMLERLAPEVTGRFEAGALLEGRLLDYDPVYDLSRVALGAAVITAPGRARGGPGASVRLRFRARDVSIARGALEGLSIRNQLPATILDIRSERGAYAEVTLALEGAGRDARLLARVTRAAVDALELRPGLAVTALVKAAAFDRRLGAGSGGGGVI